MPRSPTPSAPCRFPLRPTLGRPLWTALVAAVSWLAGAPPPAASQLPTEEPVPDRLALFLDCNVCDETFIRQEMTYVDYVRDREVADIHVLVTQQRTGAGGEAQTIELLGVGAFAGMDQTGVFTTLAGTTEDEEREGFLRTLQALLVPYLLRTSAAERIRVEVEEPEGPTAAQAQPVDDPWHQWTIELYADGSADFESRQQSFDTRYGIYINRVTEDWKIQLRPFFNYNYDRFEREDETIRSTARRDGFTSYVVRSISPHWSVGAFGDVFTSTFDNVEMRYRLMPAIEYSL